MTVTITTTTIVIKTTNRILIVITGVTMRIKYNEML